MWPRILASLLAVFAPLTGVSTSSAAQPENLAFIDVDKTNSAVFATGGALAEVLNYDYRRLAENAQHAQARGTPRYVAQHTERMEAVRSTVTRQRQTVATRVVAMGVRDLRADTARLVVFLDQRVTRGDTDKTTLAGSAAVVDLALVDGQWKLDAISEPAA
jgi:Mce-associated membrane protein